MDIVQIGSHFGKLEKFRDLVHPSVKTQVDNYIRKAGGPEYVSRHEKPISPIECLEEAFKPLEQYRDQIGVVMDGSTTRGFAEPSAAALYAQHLGINGAVCFDVSEACNGWARGAETAFMLFQQNKNLKDKYILVINNEQPPSTRPQVPQDNTDYKAIASYYVGLSFSYVCTCTLFEKTDNYSWKFDHFTNTKYASYICVPLPQQSSGYLPKCDEYKVDLNESYGQFIIPAFHQVEDKSNFMRNVVNENQVTQKFYNKAHVICHTFAQNIYNQIWKGFKFAELSICYKKLGNLGSCSFPFIASDFYNGNLPIGQNFNFCGNAAGGSNVMVSFSHRVQQKQNFEEEDNRLLPCL